MLEVSLQSALQSQILCCNLFSQDLCAQSATLLAEADLLLSPVEAEDYFEEADLLLLMHTHVIHPLTEYYFDTEADLGDINPDND